MIVIYAHTHVDIASRLCFIHVVLGTAVTPPTPSGDFAIEVEQLTAMTRDHNGSALQQYGGASLS